LIEEAPQQIAGQITFAYFGDAIDHTRIISDARQRERLRERAARGQENYQRCFFHRVTPASPNALLPGKSFESMPRYSQMVTPRSTNVERVPSGRAPLIFGPAIRNGTYSRV